MPRGNTYTEEHINFLKEYGPGHTLDEIWEAFFDKFEMDISKASIQYLVSRYNIPHNSRKGLASKCTKERGEEKIEYKRTQVRGSEEIFNLIEDACHLFGMKKYEFCNRAITSFLKDNGNISWDLRSKKYPTKSKYINVDIPSSLEEDVKELAIKNGCSAGILIVQALINYGVSKLPKKLDTFKSLVTIDSNNLTSSTSTDIKNDSKFNSGRHYWSKQEIEYVRSIASTNTFNSLLDRCNKEFDFVVTESALRTQMSRNNIAVGIKVKCGGKSNKDTESTKKVKNKVKNQKYYVDGMEEIKFDKDTSSDVSIEPIKPKDEPKTSETTLNDDKVKITKIPEEVFDVMSHIKEDADIIPKPTSEVSSESIPEVSTKDTVDTSKSKQVKRYVIPQDIPKIVERVRKITTASRFEVCNCAVTFYLARKWHIDKRLKIAKYYDSSWLNTKFIQPITITLDMMNQLEKVADQYHCKISTVIIQAYLDYSSKIFDDCGIEFNYVFESDTYKPN